MHTNLVIKAKESIQSNFNQDPLNYEGALGSIAVLDWHAEQQLPDSKQTGKQAKVSHHKGMTTNKSMRIVFCKGNFSP
jgi:hypothetical protein